MPGKKREREGEKRQTDRKEDKEMRRPITYHTHTHTHHTTVPPCTSLLLQLKQNQKAHKSSHPISHSSSKVRIPALHTNFPDTKHTNRSTSKPCIPVIDVIWTQSKHRAKRTKEGYINPKCILYLSPVRVATDCNGKCLAG
jgi:hypothetical protein